MVTVKLTEHKEVKKVKWKEGLTVGDILEDSRWTATSISTFVNGIAASEDTKLNDGDELILVPLVGGG